MEYTISQFEPADYTEVIALWQGVEGVGLHTDVDSRAGVAAFLARNPGLSFTARMGALLAWGAQLGWGDLTLLLKPEHQELLAFFTRLCRLRAEHADLFACGDLLRPPALVSGSAAILTSLWQRGGSTVLLAANPTREAAQAVFRLAGVRKATREVALPALGAQAIPV